MVRFINLSLNEKGRFLWSAHRITEKQKAGKARNIKEKQLKNSRNTASRLHVVLPSSASADFTVLRLLRLCFGRAVFCLTEVSQRTGEHDCAYPVVASEGRAGCAFRIIAQASRGRRSRPSDAPQFSKCNSDDRRQRRKQGGAVGAAASRI